MPLTEKYAALYAENLVAHHKYIEAIKTLEKYGISSNPNNFEMYRKLIIQVSENKLI